MSPRRGSAYSRKVAARPPDDEPAGATPVEPVRAGVEEGPDGEWEVRLVRPSAATKAYRCPGCDQEIRPTVPHVVAWPVGTTDADGRRHWHTACWQARSRRGVKVHRSKNAPRYG